MYTGLQVKHQLFLSNFNYTWVFSRDFRKNTQTSNFMNIHSVGAELFHAGWLAVGGTDGQTNGWTHTWRSYYSLFAILRRRLKIYMKRRRKWEARWVPAKVKLSLCSHWRRTKDAQVEVHSMNLDTRRRCVQPHATVSLAPANENKLGVGWNPVSVCMLMEKTLSPLSGIKPRQPDGKEQIRSMWNRG
jgi:hypothetical protein